MARRSAVCSLGLLALLPACGEGFRSPARLDRVRALAVRSEPGSGVPGGTVKLELLAVAETEAPQLEEGRELQIAWLGGCHNPPGRQHFACYPLLSRLAAELEPSVLQTPLDRLPQGLFGVGDSFSLPIPDNILSAAPRVATDPEHFGVSYAFFGLCAGELRASSGLQEQVPFDCVDKTSGRPVSARDFVTGFATVYSYEAVQNANPILEGVTLDGAPLPASACERDADCTVPSAAGTPQGCSRRGACVPVFPPCPKEGRCRGHRVLPEVGAGSVERHAGGDEILWVNFYATAGRFQAPTQLVSDRQLGLIDDPSGVWRAPALPVGDVRLWVTLHDQRGGTAWTSFDVLVRP